MPKPQKLNPDCPSCQARARGIRKAQRAGRCGRFPAISRDKARKYVDLRASGKSADDAAKAIGATPQGARKAAKKYGFTA